MPTLIDDFRSIASIAVDDGVVLDATSVTGSPIRKDDSCGVVRIDLGADPKATVVANKLHAVTVLGMANTRM